jgi:hypothetical protein
MVKPGARLLSFLHLMLIVLIGCSYTSSVAIDISRSSDDTALHSLQINIEELLESKGFVKRQILVDSRYRSTVFADPSSPLEPGSRWFIEVSTDLRKGELGLFVTQLSVKPTDKMIARSQEVLQMVRVLVPTASIRER